MDNQSDHYSDLLESNPFELTLWKRPLRRPIFMVGGLVIVAALWGSALTFGVLMAGAFASNPGEALDLWREATWMLGALFSATAVGVVLCPFGCYCFARQVLLYTPRFYVGVPTGEKQS